MLAKEGLRTMCLGYKYLSEETYQNWCQELHEASLAITARKKHVYRAYSKIERDLVYIGCSGIEDSLQEGVPETIMALKDAGIIVWMLTGDKRETAVSIGWTCNLISKDTALFNIEGNSIQSVYNSLQECLDNTANLSAGKSEICFVVSGEVLRFAFPTKTESRHKSESAEEQAQKRYNLKLLHELLERSSSVICCRMSPIQKGQIVRMMKGGKTSKRKRCLAIGDGGKSMNAIDVPVTNTYQETMLL